MSCQQNKSKWGQKWMTLFICNILGPIEWDSINDKILSLSEKYSNYQTVNAGIG